jgi:hypothetical protein
MAINNETVQAVWEKSRALNDRDSSEWRKDECGAWMRRDLYGNQVSEFGWKIENISPDEPQTLKNLRAYQHQNHFIVDTGKPHCLVTADREGISPTASIDMPRNKSDG